MGRRCLMIPTDKGDAIEVIDLDEVVGHTDALDPYKVGRGLLDCDTAVLLHTSRTDTYVVIDEDAMLKGFPPNTRASSRFYPAVLYGEVLLVHIEWVNVPQTDISDADIELVIGDLHPTIVRHAEQGDYDG